MPKATTDRRFGGSVDGGETPRFRHSWLVKISWENPNRKWMITRGTSLGNLHMDKYPWLLLGYIRLNMAGRTYPNIAKDVG